MTTKAQLKKAALGLPETHEDITSGMPSYRVREVTFASLPDYGHAELHLSSAALAETLQRYPSARLAEPDVIQIPLADVNGMDLNALVRKAWLYRAPEELAKAANSAGKGLAEHNLPANIGRPATRALLLAGITNLDQVAGRTQEELLDLHGVGPKAVRLLGEELEKVHLNFRKPA